MLAISIPDVAASVKAENENMDNKEAQSNSVGQVEDEQLAVQALSTRDRESIDN